MIQSRSILFLLFFIPVFFARGQGHKIDSLKQILEKSHNLQTQCNLLSSIGLEYYHRQIYLDSAFYYSSRAYDIAKENKFILEQAKALSVKGNVYNFLGENNKAIETFFETVKLYDLLGDSRRVSGIYNNIGATYFELKQYDLAIDNYNKSLNIARELDDKFSISIAIMNIAETLYVNGDYLAAKDKFEESLLAMRGTSFNPPTVHLFYARTLKALGDLDLALFHAQESLKIAEKQNDLKYAQESSKLLSEIFEAVPQYDQALIFQKKYNDYSKIINEAKEINELEKQKLNIELKEKDRQLTLAAQKEKYLTVIWVLVILGVLLLILLIHRQVKVTRMTKSILDVQKRLVESELIKRENKNSNITSFQAAKEQDKEL